MFSEHVKQMMMMMKSSSTAPLTHVPVSAFKKFNIKSLNCCVATLHKVSSNAFLLINLHTAIQNLLALRQNINFSLMLSCFQPASFFNKWSAAASSHQA